MKKIGVVFHKDLQKALGVFDADEAAGNMQALSHILSLIPFVVEIGVTGRIPVMNKAKVCAPITSGNILVAPSHRDINLLKEYFSRATRIQFEIYMGIAPCCLGVRVFFRKDGEPVGCPLEGCAESGGLRFLKFS